jgi:hypothetical protein
VCQGSEDCDWTSGLVCDDSLRCKPIVLAGEGAACTGDFPFVPTTSARACDGFHSCQNGTCTAGQRPARGAPASCLIE